MRALASKIPYRAVAYWMAALAVAATIALLYTNWKYSSYLDHQYQVISGGKGDGLP